MASGLAEHSTVHGPEYLTIQRNVSDIVTSLAAQVDPSLFAQKLSEIGIVSTYVVQKASARDVLASNRIQDVMQAVLVQIKLDPSTYHNFIDVLRDEYQLLAEKLTASYGLLTTPCSEDPKSSQQSLARSRDQVAGSQSRSGDLGSTGEGELQPQPAVTPARAQLRQLSDAESCNLLGLLTTPCSEDSKSSQQPLARSRDQVAGSLSCSGDLGSTGEGELQPQPAVTPARAQVRQLSDAESCNLLDRKPILKELQKFVVPHASEFWEDLGIELNLDDDGTTLDKIRQERGGNASKCCLDVVKIWLQGVGVQPKTWRVLLGCLQGVLRADTVIASIQKNIFTDDVHASDVTVSLQEQPPTDQAYETYPLQEAGNSSTEIPQDLSTAIGEEDRSDADKLKMETEAPIESSVTFQPTETSAESITSLAGNSDASPRPNAGSSTPGSSIQLDYSLILQPPDRVRDYQWELAEPGINGQNYIICAPTGTGKTLTAALIISEHLKKMHRRGKVIFVVNTRPLADQQRKEIQKVIPGANVESCTGHDMHRTIKLLLRDCNVIVCTAGKFLQELKQGRTNFEEVSLMVFDECHHTHKDSQYANIMMRYLEQATKSGQLPQVVGMTASPGAGTKTPDLKKTLTHLHNLCALLDASGGIKIVERHIAELDRHTNKPTFHLQVFDPRDPSDPFIHLITDEMNRLEEFTTLRCSSKKWSQEYETSVQQKKIRLEGSSNPANRDEITALEMLQHFSQVLGIYMDLTHEAAISVLDEFSRLPSLKRATAFERTLSERVDMLKSQLLQVNKLPNPLLEKVEDRIHNQFKRNPESRGILFVRTKRHASCVCEWAANFPVEMRIRPAEIVGQTKDGSQGMTQAKQREVIQGFREGKYNLLVATSVAEEGLDVPACNLVIRFQHVTNEIAKKQTLGRARAFEAEGFTILSSDTNQEFQELRNAELENIIEKALHHYFPERKDLTNSLREVQEKLLKDWAMKRKRRAEKRLEDPREAVQILCKKCKVVACQGTDIYTVDENGSHYVVANDNFKDTMITKRPHHTPLPVSTKANKTHKIYCANCEADWGVLFIYPSQGNQFPVLKCKQFIFEVNGFPRPVSKWSLAPFEIPPLSTHPDYQYFD